MLNPTPLLLETLCAERERELIETARAREWLRSRRGGRRVSPLRRATGRLLVRAGMWLLVPGPLPSA